MAANEVQAPHVNTEGSVWRRWDPHIHTPGTLKNDQFGKENAWTDYWRKLDELETPVDALGITDYCSIRGYLRALETVANAERKRFIFPNVELRLGIQTSKGDWINLHLIFDPSPNDHVAQIQRILSSLEFKFQKDTYRCTNEDLVRLGRAFRDSAHLPEEAALKEGAQQFKVDLEKLRELEANQWFSQHCLVAVAAGADGTSGLNTPDGAWAAQRKEIESFAHIIFSGQPSQIEFWLGKGKVDVFELERQWRGRKPCLHGSDAHDLVKIGRPDNDRFTWIKGDLSFESLRQACIEPEERVYVGASPPLGPLKSRVISSARFQKASWLKEPEIHLNPGLVAVIGARGSGKTAFADMIAAAAQSDANYENREAFLNRASKLLGEEECEIEWADATKDPFVLRNFGERAFGDEDIEPKVQYLSQQFVERLCGADGLGEPLIREIQRVIFESHPWQNRLGTESFEELLVARLENSKIARESSEDSLNATLRVIAEERDKKSKVSRLQKQLKQSEETIEKDKKSRQALVSKGDEQRLLDHTRISDALQSKRQEVERLRRSQAARTSILVDVAAFSERVGDPFVRDLKSNRKDAALAPGEWEKFKPEISAEGVELVKEKLNEGTQLLSKILGRPDDQELEKQSDSSMSNEAEVATGAPATGFLEPGIDLQDQTLRCLELEEKRLGSLVVADREKAAKYKALTERIGANQAAVEKLRTTLQDHLGADARLNELLQSRKEQYAEIFSSIIEEETELKRLYQPLQERLSTGGSSVSKLSFSVNRVIDLDRWAKAGEELIDLRKSGSLKGRGELARVAKDELMEEWMRGTAEQASTALASFIDRLSSSLNSQKPDDVDLDRWKNAVSNWLFSTDHVSVSYSMEYNGIDIAQLSPGTRGVVLLLLYLTLDTQDERPLIIDQPEENLDPQSIFYELVPQFRETKKRRQIIIVTHNANLVVNTDADQVIVATSGSQSPTSLPLISYTTGGLENATIRKRVCEILEGGERALKERARRLRVSLASPF